MGLMNEAICHGSVYGKRLKDGVRILAALNPYRRSKKSDHQSPGLVFQLHQGETENPMADLIYRVHPIPHTLRDFIFDFGSLSEENEKSYIRSMITTTFSKNVYYQDQILSNEIL